MNLLQHVTSSGGQKVSWAPAGLDLAGKADEVAGGVGALLPPFSSEAER